MAIGLYERGFSAGQPPRESRETTSSFYNSIRNMPLLEAIVGTSSNDLYDAIFDVDVMPEEDLFENLGEDEQPALRSVASSIRLRASRSRGRTPGPAPTTSVQSPPLSPTSPTKSRGTPNVSPMMRPITISTSNLLEPGQSSEVPRISPLARLFAGDSPVRGRTTSIAGASLKKVETALEEIKRLPVNKLAEEMRELQVRFIFLLPFSPPAFGGGICIQSSPFGDPLRILYVHPAARLALLLFPTLHASVAVNFSAHFLFARIVKHGSRTYC